MRNKIRAAWLAPCIGTGGADALMTGLIRAARTVEFTGVGILRSGHTTLQQATWARLNGLSCPIHLWNPPDAEPLPLITHSTPLKTASMATAHADIAIAWCCGGDQVDMRAIYPALGIPVVELSQNEDQTLKELLAYNAPAAHYYAACSQSAAAIFPEALRDRVNVIYNAVDPLRVTPRAGRAATREALGYADGDRVVLFLGRFVAEKNPEALIQALTMLPGDYKALFAGRGPETATLVNAAKRYAPARCQFVDFVDHPGDLYAAADCFSLPSDFEGDPLAVHEAQLAGLPCVVAEYSAVDELEALFETPMFWRVPRRPTSEQMAAAIREATERPDARVATAREITWREFSLSRIAYQWEDFLRECLHDWQTKALGYRAKRPVQPIPFERPQ